MSTSVWKKLGFNPNEWAWWFTINWQDLFHIYPVVNISFFRTNRMKTRQVSSMIPSARRTFPLVANDHYFHLKIVLFCSILKSWDGRTDVRTNDMRDHFWLWLWVGQVDQKFKDFSLTKFLEWPPTRSYYTASIIQGNCLQIMSWQKSQCVQNFKHGAFFTTIKTDLGEFLQISFSYDFSVSLG